MKIAVFIFYKEDEYPIAVFDNFKEAIDYKDKMKAENQAYLFYHRAVYTIEETDVIDLEIAKRFIKYDENFYTL